MSEHDGSQSSTKQRRSRKTSTANQQNGKQTPVAQRPANDDTEEWKAYWKQQGQPWRTEPEIDADREKYLTERRSIKPDIEKGIYPFKAIEPNLSRADIEWLLATHENGRGPVDWDEEKDKPEDERRTGLDLRGADLSQANLADLPLARMRGELTMLEWVVASEEQRSLAAVHLEQAKLMRAQLQGADLVGAQLQGAKLFEAQLQGADLGFAQLQQADLNLADLREANLEGAQLQGADLVGAQLQQADLRGAQLQGANLVSAQLQQAYMEGAQLQQAKLMRAQLQQAKLMRAQLQGANLGSAQLQGADLFEAQLQGADLRRTDLDHATLEGITFSDQTRFADIRWGDINLTVVDWEHVTTLGDEQVAHQKKDSKGEIKDKQRRVDEYKEAVRAYRQLSVVLRDQGMNEDASRFAYRAQLMQRIVVRRQGKIIPYLFSGFLDLLAGYGYKPWRSFVAYLIVILVFATMYFSIGSTVGPTLSPVSAWVFSMTSFHGRGFFPGGIKLDDPLTILAAIEAFVGLLIEVTFIATLTQRLFGK